MDRQGPTLAKSFSTFATLEWFFLAVDIPVVSEMILSSKGFTADVTRVRPLVRMGSLVNQQIIRFGELSITKFTDELFLRSGRSAGSS